jgi:regulator of replication initiation timing
MNEGETKKLLLEQNKQLRLENELLKARVSEIEPLKAKIHELVPFHRKLTRFSKSLTVLSL